MVNCHYCGEDFTPTGRDFQYTAGWAQTRRDKGGANAISMPVHYDTWAHNDCVRRPGQSALLLEDIEPIRGRHDSPR